MLLRAANPSLLNRLEHRLFSSVHSPACSSQSTSRPNDLVYASLQAIRRSASANEVPELSVNAFNKSVEKIRRGLTQRNVPVVIEGWQQLKAGGLLPYIRSPQLMEISKLLGSTFDKCANAPEWNNETVLIAEDIALKSAQYHSTGALYVCMVHHLKNSNPASVLSLYDRFRSYLESSWKDGEAGMVGVTNDDGALACDPVPIPSTNDLGLQKVLLAVTTAYAMLDSFHCALKTHLASNVRHNTIATSQLLQFFRHDSALCAKVQKYMRRLSTAQLISRPSSLSKHIANLAQNRLDHKILSLYNDVTSGLRGPEAFIAPDPSQCDEQRSICLTEVVWSSFLSGFLRCERRDLAAKVWDDMTDLGESGSTTMWNTLLDAYGSISAVDEALGAWNIMVSQKVTPDALTYRAIISALFNGYRTEQAMEKFREYNNSSVGKASSSQDLIVHNTVLHGLLRAKHISEADSLMKAMLESGPRPDLVSYNTFMAYYARTGDFKAIAVLLNKMTLTKTKGDVYTFSTILSALLKAGREDAPKLILNLMRKQDIQPNVATYSALIDYQMREQDEKHLQMALQLLQEIENDPGMKPNEITYTAVLTGLYRGTWLPVAKAEQYKQSIVERMKKHDIRFSLTTYNILIKASLEYPHTNGLEQALAYYREMKQQKMPMVNNTWYILLAGLLHREEWKVADEIVREMVTFFKGKPTGSLLKLVNKIKKRDAHSDS